MEFVIVALQWIAGEALSALPPLLVNWMKPRPARAASLLRLGQLEAPAEISGVDGDRVLALTVLATNSSFFPVRIDVRSISVSGLLHDETSPISLDGGGLFDVRSDQGRNPHKQGTRLSMRFRVPRDIEARFHRMQIGSRDCVADLDAHLSCDRGSTRLEATRVNFKVTKNYAPR
jgi:hypothetical protein